MQNSKLSFDPDHSVSGSWPRGLKTEGQLKIPALPAGRQNFQMRGFTLVELLIAIAVIGILATGIFIIIDPIDQLQKGWDAQRKSDLAQIQKALGQYYGDNGRYPSHSTDTDTAAYKIVKLDGSVANWGDSWAPYMAQLPQDPKESNHYVYHSTGQAYYLYANLGRGAKDPQSCNSGNACRSLSGTGFPASEACGGTCNYGVTSANVSP